MQVIPWGNFSRGKAEGLDLLCQVNITNFEGQVLKKDHFKLCWCQIHTQINTIGRTTIFGTWPDLFVTSGRAVLQMFLLRVHSRPESTSIKANDSTHPPRLPTELGVAWQHSSSWPGSLLHSYSWAPAPPFSSYSLLLAVFLILVFTGSTFPVKAHTSVKGKKSKVFHLKCREVPWPALTTILSFVFMLFSSLHWLVMAHTPPHNTKENVLLSHQTDVEIRSYVLQLYISSCCLNCAICHLGSTLGDAGLATCTMSCS